MKKELNYSKTLVDSLPNKERTVIKYYYEEKLSLKTIGSKLGIGESRVAQIKAKALKRLELMSKRLYLVIEQNEWPDGFYVDGGAQRFGDIPSALKYMCCMRNAYINISKEQGYTIIKDNWDNINYSCLTNSNGWTQKLYIKELKSGE